MPKMPLHADDYVQGIKNRDMRLLSRAITLVESTRPDHQQIAKEVVARCQPLTGNGLRLGITGPPGAGKSTFIDSLGTLLIAQGKRVAVLAIDPSSKVSGGSILGDKTRMNRLAISPNAFIRPSPNSGRSGGLSRYTREALILCEAAGYDVVIIETVGIGQAEFEVHSMVDMVILLLITGAGDDLQGIKRGIMEMADLIVINKADGPNEKEAALLLRSLKQTMKIMPPPRPNWTTRIRAASSLRDQGLEEIWQTIEAFLEQMRTSGQLHATRRKQASDWMLALIHAQLKQAFHTHPGIDSALKKAAANVESGAIPPPEAAASLIEQFFHLTGKNAMR